MSLRCCFRGTLAFSNVHARDVALATLRERAPLLSDATPVDASMVFEVDLLAPSWAYNAALNALFDAADGAVSGLVTCELGGELTRVGPPPAPPAPTKESSAPVALGRVARHHDLVAVWMSDCTLKMTDLARPAWSWRVSVPLESVYNLDLSASTVCLYSGTELVLFDLALAAVRWRVPITDAMRVLYSRDVAVVCAGGETLALSATSGGLMARLGLDPQAIHDDWICGWDAGDLVVHRLPSLETVFRDRVADGPPSACALSADGSRAAAAYYDGRLVLVDLITGRASTTKAFEWCGCRVRLSDDGRFAALWSTTRLFVYDVLRDTWSEYTVGGNGHGLEEMNNEVVYVAADEVIARDPFCARVWRLDDPHHPRDLRRSDVPTNRGVLRRRDGALLLVDRAGRIVPLETPELADGPHDT